MYSIDKDYAHYCLLNIFCAKNPSHFYIITSVLHIDCNKHIRSGANFKNLHRKALTVKSHNLTIESLLNVSP